MIATFQIKTLYLRGRKRLLNYDMKHLIIRNFGPIDEVDIELNRINLIIGPQSSGKSSVLKIACFFDWMEKKIELTQNPDKFCEPGVFLKNLVGFHRLEGYMNPDTFISYQNDAVFFEYSEKSKKCIFHWNESKRWDYRRSKISYIPSERNLVAAIPNWYQVSMNNDNILDFMQEWEFARKAFSKGIQILDLQATYIYNPANQKDRIRLSDGNELALTMTSSGLQALTPLYIAIHYLTSEYFEETHTNVQQTILRNNLTEIVGNECGDLSPKERQAIVDRIMPPHHTDLFIEEPEAHIFPSTQKSFVYSFVQMLNIGRKHTCFIATHSPYIMTAFNNVILAGETIASSKDKAKLVENVLTKDQTLRYSEVAAFEMKDAKIRSILDDEFRLISADAIDALEDRYSNSIQTPFHRPIDSDRCATCYA